MNETRHNPIVHVLPSLTDVAFLMPLIFMFTIFDGAKALLHDANTGWHIRTGEWILANHRVPHTDLFSFTKPDAPWFAWEWLSDIIFASLHQQWGLAGVVALSMLLLCGTSALLFRLIRRHCANPLVAIVFTFLAMGASSLHWHARPHLFTMFFTVVVLHVLDRAAAGGERMLFVLPLLTAVWVNLHGGFMAGLVLLFLYMAGELLVWALDGDRANAKRHLRMGGLYGLTLAVCGVASLINPYTFHLHQFILSYLSQPYLHSISEWQTPNFHGSYERLYEAMLILALGVAVWNLTKRRYAEVLIIAAWAHLSLYSTRNIPIFALAAAPIVARAVEEMMEALRAAPMARWFLALINEIRDLGAEVAQTDRAWRVHALSAIVFLAVAVTMLEGRLSPRYEASFDAKDFPVEASAVLAAKPDSTRVFTLDRWGDFLIYRFYPKRRVYYDGRSDMYGNAFFDEYCRIVNAGLDWQQYLDRYQVETVLLPVDLPLTGAMKESQLWRAVYDDHRAIIFDRASGDRNTDQTAASRQLSRFGNGSRTDFAAEATTAAAVQAKSQAQGKRGDLTE